MDLVWSIVGPMAPTIDQTESGGGDDWGPGLEEEAHDRLRLRTCDEPARDLGRGACDARHVGVGERDAGTARAVLHDGDDLRRGTRGLARALGVPDRTVDGDGGAPPVDFVGQRLEIE